MNENTLNERIKETAKKLDESFNPEEQAMLSEELKGYKKQLAALKNKDKKKDVKLKTLIDAPIIGDRKESHEPTRQGIRPGGNGTFVVGI